MTVVVLVLIAVASLGWRKAFSEYQRAEMERRHYQIAMDGWRGTIESMNRLTRDAQALLHTERHVVRQTQERVH